MSKRHGAREQKKQAKQKAKRDARRRQLARQSSPDPNIRLKTADRWPIVATLAPKNLWSQGLGNVVVARRTPSGQLACGVFLVDVFCLGVKNAFWQIVTSQSYENLLERLEESGGPFERWSPECLSKLVHCAADYGQSLGFSPHTDFRHARLLLTGIDPSLCNQEFEFGKDGRPFYIRGPGESLAKAQLIAERVHALGGHYLVQLDEGDPRIGFPSIEDAFADDEDELDDDLPRDDYDDGNIIDV